MGDIKSVLPGLGLVAFIVGLVFLICALGGIPWS